ncbi:MAG: EAL domain-containing protein, partial [Gammaproteobacteria bacterium]|nr:EAL domain-containing protein [Gammaproteobacteria bacterium]
DLEDLLGRNISSLLAYDEKGDLPFFWPQSKPYSRCSQGKADKVDENIFGARDDGFFAAEFIATPISRADNPFAGAVFALRDITQRKQAEKQLIHSARYDQLTGLVNRNYFEEVLERALARARRNGTLVGLMFIDLDHFKEVNDTLGHNAGDELLRQVSSRLNSCVREIDTLCRLGGDEFTLILESMHDESNLAGIAEKLLKHLSECFLLTRDDQTHKVFIGASIGMVTYPHTANNVIELLRCADIAMYYSKNNGRNSYEAYSPQMEAKVRRSLEIEGRMRTAIQNEEFTLHYQPQVDSFSEEIIGIEALVRWEPNEGEAIYPDEFIPIAEETGLIVELGYWILAKACEDIKVIHENHETPITLSVNLSVRQLINSDICDGISRIIHESGINPSLLNFEITESMVMDNPEEKIAKLNSIKDLGVSISVDDFGTGYSSLSYIKQLPIDTLKIDRAFVEDIDIDHQGEAIIKTIISMAQSLNLKVVAEGVETIEQLHFLQGNNCSIIQGYYYSRPIPLEDFLKLHAKGIHPANDAHIDDTSSGVAR